MRVLIVDTYYPGVFRDHYRRRPGLAEAPYRLQLDELMGLRFGTSDAYSHALRALGHEAAEVVVNCPPLQRAWASEAGFRRPLGLLSRGIRARRAALLSIAIEQVRVWRPDVLYVQDMWFFPRPALAWLRRRARLIVGQIASPAPPRRTVSGYDLVVTSFPHFVERFQSIGVDSVYLPLAFDARVLEDLRRKGVDPSPAAARPIPVSFVGGVDARVHATGTRLLEHVAQAADIEIWGYGRETLSPASPVLSHHRGPAWGLEMYEILARSQIVLNRHIDVAAGYANNMRLYEATGTGALLVTDRGRNLKELFEPGREVAVYQGGDELLATVERFLASDDERRAVASAGQSRTLRDHTYERRMAELVALLEPRV